MIRSMPSAWLLHGGSGPAFHGRGEGMGPLDGAANRQVVRERACKPSDNRAEHRRQPDAAAVGQAVILEAGDDGEQIEGRGHAPD